MPTPEEKSEEIETINALNYSKLLATFITLGYLPEKARGAARLTLALVGLTMLARALG